MSRIRFRALVLATILATAHASSIPSYFRRDGVCGGSSSDKLAQCQEDLDEGLCCAEGQTCIYLAGGTTVLCCPSSVCNRVMPITCNVNNQKPELFPKAIIKTTALKAALPRCGGNCCPFGFSCNNEGSCDMDEDQSQRPRDLPDSELPSTTPIHPSSMITPTIISPTIASTTANSATSTGSAVAEEQKNDGSTDNKNDPLPTAIIVVSVLGGLLVLVSLAVGAVMFLARRKRKPKPSPRNFYDKKHSGTGLHRPSTSTSSFGNFISEPIPNQDSALRTDFILKSPSSTSTRPSQRLSALFRRDGESYGGTTAINSPEGGSGAVNGPKSPPRFPTRNLSNATMTTNNHPALAIPPIRTMRNQQKPQINTGSAWTRHAAARAAVPDAATPIDPMRPVTPHLQREPSSESINIFADPSTVGSGKSFGLEPPRPRRLTSGTTFTDLMDQAELGDVRRGKPFVPTTPRR